MAASKTEIHFAVPKGRMFENIKSLLDDSGIHLKVDARNLRPAITLPNWTVKLLKPRNVVEMLAHGTRDIGFSGLDLVHELGADDALVSYYDTGLDPVRIVVAVPPHFLNQEGKIPADRKWRIATEYVQLTTEWAKAQHLDAEIIRTFGSTEVFPPEDADFIVDNTATGTTLRANGLIIYETLMTSSTQVFIHKKVLEQPEKKREIDNFVLLLQGVLQARSRVLIDFNIPSQECLSAVLSDLPSLLKPTISNLSDGQGFAVRSAVPRSSLATLIPSVKAAGGTDIIVSKVDQLIL